MEQTQERIAAMSHICAGMTLEEMQNAPFTYQSLLEIVQRRDVRDKKKDHAFDCGLKHGWNNCLEMISKMGEQK